MSPWIQHLKDWSKKHNMSYTEAMKSPACKQAYKKK